MFISTLPARNDSRLLRWQKGLAAVQALAGSSPANNPERNDTVRRCQFKLARALGLTPAYNASEPVLLRALLVRANALGFVAKTTAPPTSFYGSGVLAANASNRAALESKLLSLLGELQSFSESGAAAVVGTAFAYNNPSTVLLRKLVTRLAQAPGMSGGLVPPHTLGPNDEVVSGEDGSTYRAGEDGGSVSVSESSSL